MSAQTTQSVEATGAPEGTRLLAGKRLLVTGVLSPASIAFAVAERAQQEGAEIVLTSFGRGMRVTQRAAGRLPVEPEVLELDVQSPEDLDSLAGRLGEPLDGVVHAIAFAPESCLGGGFVDAPWADVAASLEVSAYSLAALVRACRPLLGDGASVVGLDFDASHAWPAYDWMGVSKAALESVARYLARELGGSGVRVNLVAAGPLRTIAARSIPGFSGFEDIWKDRAPLGWAVDDPAPVAAACVALLSDLFPSTTGEIVHVDGGAHAMGA